MLKFIFILSGIIINIICIYSLIILTKNTNKNTIISKYYYDGSQPSFFITGDKHRNFDDVKNFCKTMNTKSHDVLIILGDAGFNYYGDKRDDKLKKEISELNITLFCIHGNKENRPKNIMSYGIRTFCEGKVYYEPKYPNIFFAIDGQIYTFENKKYIAIGGAHSIDKMVSLEKGKPFWHDEMPDDIIKKDVECSLRNENNKIYGILSHTCPLYCIPTEMFKSTQQNIEINKSTRKRKPKNIFKPDIDRSTEIWLDEIEQNTDYNVWFCGHYHIDKQIDKIQMMYHDIRPLHMQLFGDK